MHDPHPPTPPASLTSTPLAEEPARTSIEPAALARIAALAVEHVDGADLAGPPERSVQVEALPGEDLRVALRLAGAYGTSLPDLADRVRAEVVGVVGAMTRLHVGAVDVEFVELTPAR